MRTYLLRSLLILTFVAELWSRVHAQTLAGDNLYLYPSQALPLTCNTGDVRFDNVAGTLKFCVLNAWVAAGGGFSSPMTAVGDMIVGGASGTPTALGIGTTNAVLISNGTSPAWTFVSDANVTAGAGIAYSKLNLSGSVQNADITAAAGIAYSKLNLAGAILGTDVSTAANLTVATLQVNSTSSLLGAAVLGSTLQVTGASTFLGALTAGGTSIFTGASSHVGQVLLANGVVGTPSLSFTNDTGTGVYRAAASEMGFAVAGVNGLYMLNQGSFVNLGFGITPYSSALQPVIFNRSQNGSTIIEYANSNTGSSGASLLTVTVANASGIYTELATYTNQGASYTPNPYLSQISEVDAGFNMLGLLFNAEYTSATMHWTFGTPGTATEVLALTTAAFTLRKSMPFNLAGSTSGTVSTVVQPTAGTYNWNWPTTSGSLGNLLVSGGGGTVAMTWTAASCATLSNGAASCSVDTTNASNISSGTLATAQLPATIAIGTNATTNGVLSLATNTAAGTSVSILNGGSTTAFNFVLPQGPGGLGQVLTSGGGTSPMTWGSSLANPMSGGGDMIIGGAAGAATRLASGTAGNYLKSNGTGAETWAAFGLPIQSNFTVAVGGGRIGHVCDVSGTNATAGAIYTSSAVAGQNFTVFNTIQSGTVLAFLEGSTLGTAAASFIRTSGGGDGTIAASNCYSANGFTPDSTALYAEIFVLGPGGGGAGSDTAATGGGTAQPTYFVGAGANLMMRGGPGSGGLAAAGGGPASGGVNSFTAAVGFCQGVDGGDGQGGNSQSITTNYPQGGQGGSSARGGNGGGGTANQPGSDAKRLSGSGGGGGGGLSVAGSSGGGGGGGGSVQCVLPMTASATYLYSVSNAGGVNGTGSKNGGAGAQGIAWFTTKYQ